MNDSEHALCKKILDATSEEELDQVMINAFGERFMEAIKPELDEEVNKLLYGDPEAKIVPKGLLSLSDLVETKNSKSKTLLGLSIKYIDTPEIKEGDIVLGKDIILPNMDESEEEQNEN